MERPSGNELDGAARLLASARARLSAAAADLALPQDLRLTEWQRRTVSALLESLVGSIEDELRSALVATLEGEGLEPARAAFASASVQIALPILRRGEALSDPALIAALMRRAEEHRLHRKGGEPSLLLELANDEDAEVAADAMAVLLAQSARLDAFQEPLMGRAELPAELEHGLLWAVAAALRTYLTVRHGADPAAADEAIAAAAARLLARYDEGETFDARCLRLVGTLRDKERDGGLAARALSGGSLTLALAAMARASGIAVDAVWQLLSDPSGNGAALILRAARLSRADAGAILVALGRGEPQVAGQLDRFDGLSPAEADRLLTLWRADPSYRAAVAGLAA
ncbi:MAG: DUF2336 domain-containing protein [Elioraea tepidiphila]